MAGQAAGGLTRPNDQGEGLLETEGVGAAWERGLLCEGNFPGLGLADLPPL